MGHSFCSFQEPHHFKRRIELGKFARLLEAEASFWMLVNIIQI